MNIWHNISPKRIKKNRFYAVIEIPKGGKTSTSLIKKQVCSNLTEFFSPQHTTLLTTDLFHELTPATTTRLTYLFSAVKNTAYDDSRMLTYRRSYNGGRRKQG